MSRIGSLSATYFALCGMCPREYNTCEASRRFGMRHVQALGWKVHSFKGLMCPECVKAHEAQTGSPFAERNPHKRDS